MLSAGEGREKALMITLGKVEGSEGCDEMRRARGKINLERASAENTRESRECLKEQVMGGICVQPR